MSPLVSVVVPVLADADAAGRLLRENPADPRAHFIIVDGGPDPRAGRLADGRPDVEVITAPRGRASQMNAGARLGSAPWLLFLHADCRLPEGWLDALAALPPAVGGGWFRFALDSDEWQARLVERGARWRVRWLRLPYGDQGLFVRRQRFQQLGGFPPLALMEDVAFVRRLVRSVEVVELPLALVTSARRYHRDGWLRRSGTNLLLVALYFSGVSPERLLRWYERRSPLPPG